MSRQIDADRLYEVIKNSWDTSDAEDFEKSVFVALATAPTIEQRKTGKWLPDNNNYYEERYICSACNRSYKVDVCMGKPMWHFCPDCGADMIGEGECTKKI